jgi:hypothetical protein
MSAARIAEALSGRRALRLADGSYLVSCPLPSHGKGRGDLHPSLSIRDGASQILVYCHARCDPRDVLDALRQRGLLDNGPSRISGFDRDWKNARAKMRRPREDDDLVRIKRAREIWHAARDPRGTLAQTYLSLRRLALDDALAGRVLRFHPRTPWRNENTGKTEFLPALIAAFRSLDDDEITGIQRIALKLDGHKLGRRMLGIVHRTAIKLDDNVADELAIGEGIETCMAARMLGIRPTWALGSVGMIAHFPIIPGVRTLRIIGENDQASEDAIELCGPRWQAAGCRVRVIKPTFDVKDLNDALGAHAYDGTGR